MAGLTRASPPSRTQSSTQSRFAGATERMDRRSPGSSCRCARGFGRHSEAARRRRARTGASAHAGEWTRGGAATFPGQPCRRRLHSVAAAARGERKGEGENDARVWGVATAMRVLFWRQPRTTVRSRSTAARASRLLGWKAAHAGGEGDTAAGRFGGPAVGCRASGPRKGGRAGRGPVFCSWAA